ncbi:MAG: phage holin [Clostridia bacterium]|nr:phage holin [Clostridia bacterium]
MKINLKARLKNKMFVLSASALIVSFAYQMLSAFDIVPKITENEIMGLITMAVNILAFVGVLIDPTTEGMSDSDRAMTYCTDCDVREAEEVKR